MARVIAALALMTLKSVFGMGIFSTEAPTTAPTLDGNCELACGGFNLKYDASCQTSACNTDPSDPAECCCGFPPLTQRVCCLRSGKLRSTGPGSQYGSC